MVERGSEVERMKEIEGEGMLEVEALAASRGTRMSSGRLGSARGARRRGDGQRRSERAEAR